MPSQDDIESLKSSLESIENTLNSVDDISGKTINDAFGNLT
jgi:hypothetical protein